MSIGYNLDKLRFTVNNSGENELVYIAKSVSCDSSLEIHVTNEDVGPSTTSISSNELL